MEAGAPPGTQPTRRIALTGSPEGIDRAKRDLDDMLRARRQSGGFPVDPATAACSETVVVSNDKVGLIIGKGGLTVKGIQERTGAHVRIPSQADADDASKRTLTVCGDHAEAVAAARREIDALLYEEQMRNSGGSIADDPVFGPATPVPVPEGCVGLIIGRGGETISRLQQATGARIQIPNEPHPGTNPPMRYILVGGLPDARQRAHFEIMQLVAQHEARNPGSGTALVDPYASQMVDPYAASSQAAPAAAFPADAYHNDFWNYVGWYGEDAARATYGAYAPPVGSKPPPPPPEEPLPPGMAAPPEPQQQQQQHYAAPPPPPPPPAQQEQQHHHEPPPPTPPAAAAAPAPPPAPAGPNFAAQILSEALGAGDDMDMGH